MTELRKVRFLRTFLIGISGWFLSACTHAPENLKAIPEETTLVSAIDLYSIAQKGGLEELADYKFFKAFKKEIRSENKKIAKIIDNIIEDPSQSGINFKTDLFIYVIDEATDEQFTGFTVELSNEATFAEFIEEVLDKADIDYDIEEEKNYRYTNIGDEALIGWDKHKAVLLAADNYVSRENLDLEIEVLMELKEKEQITSNEVFNAFYKNKKDISLWMSTNLFEGDYIFEQVSKNVDFDLSDNYISVYLNFGDQDISLLTELTPNSDLQKMMQENNVWDNSFNTQLLQYFPEENYATTSLSVNPMSYYEILEQNDDFDKMESGFEKQMGVSMEEVFKAIKGNVVYSLFGFENTEYTYMDWGYGFNESEATALDQQLRISIAGSLSSEEKELLNQGKTIQTRDYYGYCINIKNILAEGGDVETALANDSKINWFKGGWDYGKYKETTREEFLPLMGLAIDLDGDKTLKKLIGQIPESILNKRNHYYEFLFYDKYPTYLAFDKDVCLITNHKKSIKAFKDGGYSTDHLGNSSAGSQMANSHFYAFLNLNFDDYPKGFKNEVQENQNEDDKKMLKIWNELAKSIELKQVDKNSFEIIFNTKDHDSNSLHTIIKTMDDHYKSLMSM